MWDSEEEGMEHIHEDRKEGEGAGKRPRKGIATGETQEERKENRYMRKGQK